jgi:hypothetical protein
LHVNGLPKVSAGYCISCRKKSEDKEIQKAVEEMESNLIITEWCMFGKVCDGRHRRVIGSPYPKPARGGMPSVWNSEPSEGGGAVEYM